MHLHLLLVVGGFLGAARAQQCSEAQTGPGYVYTTVAGVSQPQCCPTFTFRTPATVLSCDPLAFDASAGVVGRKCVWSSGQGAYIEIPPGVATTVTTVVQGNSGQDASAGALGGLGTRVSVQIGLPAFFSTRTIMGGFSSAYRFPGTRGQGGTFGQVQISGPSASVTIIAGGGGGAGKGPAGSASTGGNAPTAVYSINSWNDPPYLPDDPALAFGGAGASGIVNGLTAQNGAFGTANGGQGGFSGLDNMYAIPGVSYARLFSSSAPRGGGALSVLVHCVPWEPLTTITQVTPSSTSTSTSTRFLSTRTVTPATSVTLTTTTLENAGSLTTLTETSTPPVSLFTSVIDSTTTPPLSFTTSTFTPAVSLFTTTSVETISPATRTVSSTFTPPTSSFKVTISETSTPALVVVPSTVTPATSTLTKFTTITTTPRTSTLTAVTTSSTGAANCISLRLVFPAACCPNEYLDMVKRPRLRRDLAPRALTTTSVTSGIASTVVTVDQTTTTTAATPLSTSVSTAFTPGPVTTISTTATAAAPSETTTTTAFFEAAADTSTEISTLVASTSTEVVPTTTTLETPIYSDIATAAAPSVTETITLSFVDPTPTSTLTVTASTPLSSVTSTQYSQAATPVTTTSTTAFARSTACALQLDYEQKQCATGARKVLERIEMIALIKLKKLVNGKPVVIDCGTAGTFTY